MKKEGSVLTQNLRRWLPGVLISVIALIVVFKLANWDDLGSAFAAIRPFSIGLALVFTILSMITKSMVWRTLLDNKASLMQTFLIVNEGYFLNNILPLRAGEIGRAIFMGQTSGLGTFHVLSTIVIERAFDVAIAAGLLLATLPLTLGMDDAESIAITALVLIVVGFIVLFLMAQYNRQVKSFVEKISRRWPLVERVLLPQIESLLDGLSVLTKPSQFLKSVFWVLITWIFWVLLYYVMMLSIVPNAPLWWGAFVDSFLALGMAVPSAPAGLGVYEASLVWALQMVNVSNTQALAYAIVLHFMQFAVTAIFGLIGLIRQGHSISKLFDGMRKKEETQ